MDMIKYFSEQLDIIINENESLPESERIDLGSITLNKNERIKRLQEAKENIFKDRYQEELQIKEKEMAVEKVLNEFWYNMTTKPRSIEANNYKINNYSVRPDSKCKELERELARHELVLSVTRLISFKPWQIMSDSELDQRLNASPLDRRSFKSVAEGVQRLLGELSLAHARTSNSNIQTPTNINNNEEDVEKCVQFGSISHRILSSEQCSALGLITPFQQIELNIGAHDAAKHCILLLSIIRCLQHNFNNQFHIVWTFKDRELKRFHEITNRLIEIDNELKDGHKILIEIPKQFPSEKPELLIENQTTITENIEEKCGTKSGSINSFCDRTLTVMMDNKLISTWQEKFSRQPTPPLCLDKESKHWSEAERNEVEIYRKQLLNLKMEREAYKTKLRQERTQLTTILQESCNKLNTMVENLSYRKLEVDTAINQEKLKISCVKLSSIYRERALVNEEKVRNNLKECEEILERLNEERNYLLSILEEKRKENQVFIYQDKQQSQSFRREFTHLSPLVVDQLTKWYRKRPAVQFTSAQLKNLATNGEDSYEWRRFFTALKILDQSHLMSANVDSNTWNILCKLRRAKAETELKVKASNYEVSESEVALSSLDTCLTNEKKRYKTLNSELDVAIEEKKRIILDTDVQLLIPRGRIELKCIDSIEEFKNAVLVPLNVIYGLNSNIRIAGARKLESLKKMLKFRSGQILQEEWKTKVAEVEFNMLQEQLTYIQKLTISSDIRHYLQGTKINKSKVNYDETIIQRQLVELRQAIEISENNCNKHYKDIENTELEISNWILNDNRDLKKNDLDYQQRLCAELSRTSRKIKEKSEQLDLLKEELEKLKLSTFPTLFDVSV